MNPAWPATNATIALIVFAVFMALTTLVMALTMALVILAVGGIVLTLVFGTNRITRLRRLIRSSASRIFGGDG
jgi:hypothetical protein